MFKPCSRAPPPRFLAVDMKVTPEVLVDIAGKIPADVKDALWAAIKSGDFKRMEVKKKTENRVTLAWLGLGLGLVELLWL